MADAVSSTSGSGAAKEVTSSSADDAAARQKKVPRYYNPHRPDTVMKSRAYASHIVSSQQTMLENLRYTRRQLERDDRELDIFRQKLFLDQYPRKWTNYRHQMGDKEEEEDWAT